MSRSLDFADILNLLFDLCETPEGGQYRNQDVVDATGLSAGAISNWRNRSRSNITLENAVSLADFFGVSVMVFQCKTRAEVVGVIARSNESAAAVETDAMLQRIIEKVLVRWPRS
jgi:transcriptional regulator with XRE-family HTH domain